MALSDYFPGNDFIPNSTFLQNLDSVIPGKFNKNETKKGFLTFININEKDKHG